LFRSVKMMLITFCRNQATINLLIQAMVGPFHNARRGDTTGRMNLFMVGNEDIRKAYISAALAASRLECSAPTREIERYANQCWNTGY
jgi:hypothetical protein